MIKKSFLVVVCFCLSFAVNSLYVQAEATRSIVVLGDSLSAGYGMKQEQGWIHLLNQRVSEQSSPYHIINASISGETTAGGLARIPKILSNNKIDYLIIELGGNDGLRGFPPKLIKNNLLQIIQLAKEKNINVALMQIKIPPNYGPRYNKLFTEIYPDLAKSNNISLLNFFMEEIAINPELMQQDGIHPNIAAQPAIVQNMDEQLRNLMNR